MLLRQAERLLTLVEKAAKIGAVAVTAHRNADPDAVASLLVLAKLIEDTTGVTPVPVLPEGMSQPSKRVVREVLGLDPSSIASTLPEDTSILVIVDTASIGQLGVFAEEVRRLPILVVDHHDSNSLVPIALESVYDPTARATSEIVYMMLSHWNTQVDEKLLTVLLAGIVYDTRHFTMSSPRVLRIAAELMEKGAKLEQALKALQSPPMEMPERIARLKAAQRMHVYRVGDFIFAVTYVGAYESSVARALLDLGADVAIVVSERARETRVIGRARRGIVDAGFNLGRDLMEPLAKMLGGGGGGHAQAAGASVHASLERVMDAVVELIKSWATLRDLRLEPVT